ncbi:MAG: transcriptional regulator [Verrucomicrobia bacterium]|nr:MAG: transcriptional regulator [Verrucomicrobiota bacterium]
MRVPLLDLSDQYRALESPIRAQLDEILANQQFILGPKGAAFEEAIRAYCGSPNAIGVSSGTDALLAILMALEIGPGDAVITSSYSFFATAGCIARVGATPILIDIDPETCNISPSALERYLNESCRRGEDGFLREPQGKILRAIVPVHLYGLCCDMDAIQRIAERFELEVIEDAAQAIGAEYPFGGASAKAGAMGEVGYFSFYPTKNLGAAGDAGMVICQDDALAERLRACRQHGMERRYYHNFIGGNFRLDEMQAAILGVKLPFLDGWSAARRGVADVYREEFQRLGLTNQLSLPPEPYRDRGLTNHHIYHQYVIRTSQRDALREHLARKEIGSAIYYPLGLHQQKCFAYLGYHDGDFPETERAARETLALPIYPELSREAQRYVAESIAEFF